MKKLTIYWRTALVRTGFKKFPYKKEDQYIILYGNKIYAKNNNQSIDNPRLKNKFEIIYNSKSKKQLENTIEKLSKKKDNGSKYLKKQLEDLIRKSI